jgi:outer membrane protein TolC
MARLEGRPMIGVGLNYMVFTPRMENGVPGMQGMEYMPAGMGNNMVMPMVSLSLPIYRKKFKAMQAESRYNREAMELQRENATNNLITQLDETINDIRDTERRVRLYEDQVRLTQQTLDLMITSYASEGSSFEELLSVQRELLDYRLELLNTIIAQYEAYAMLDMVLARNLNEEI